MLYDLQKAIDFAFSEKKYVMNSYTYLKVKNMKRVDAQQILRSPLIREIQSIISDLEIYLLGGQTSEAVYLREAYGYLPKPEARKISGYLDNIIEGIKKYISERKGGRKKGNNSK